jgi:hypothetical protein
MNLKLSVAVQRLLRVTNGNGEVCWKSEALLEPNLDGARKECILFDTTLYGLYLWKDCPE